MPIQHFVDKDPQKMNLNKNVEHSISALCILNYLFNTTL